MSLLLLICAAVGLFIGFMVQTMVSGLRYWWRSPKGAPIVELFYPAAFWLLLAFFSALPLRHIGPLIWDGDYAQQTQLLIWVIGWGSLWFFLCRALYVVARRFERSLEYLPGVRVPTKKSARIVFWLGSVSGFAGVVVLVLASVAI